MSTTLDNTSVSSYGDEDIVEKPQTTGSPGISRSCVPTTGRCKRRKVSAIDCLSQEQGRDVNAGKNQLFRYQKYRMEAVAQAEKTRSIFQAPTVVCTPDTDILCCVSCRDLSRYF
uniref:Uncharacterized protein n=1 Tax=Tetraselmis sp. GSL018 TaxID=582737 RepID=A0A061RHS3_9CHLO